MDNVSEYKTLIILVFVIINLISKFFIYVVMKNRDAVYIDSMVSYVQAACMYGILVLIGAKLTQLEQGLFLGGFILGGYVLIFIPRE